MTTKIGYHIEIEPGRTRALAKSLRALGVELHPQMDLMVQDDESGELSHLRGEMIPEIVKLINQHLRRVDAAPKIPPYRKSWSPKRCSQFLQLALLHFHWLCQYELEGDCWQGDPQRWSSLTTHYPLVFPRQDQPCRRTA